MSEPAFPSHGSMGEVVHEGMTLRDYFIAHAPECPDHIDFPPMKIHGDHVVDLGGGRKEIRHSRNETVPERYARWSLLYSDAVLVERAK